MGLNVGELYATLGIDTTAFSSGLQGITGMLSKLGGVGGVAMAAIGAAAVGGFAIATKSAMDFDNQMELLQTQAGASAEEVRNMKGAVLDLAGQVTQTPDELAKGLFHIESAGFRGQAALDLLKTAAQGAMTGEANLEDVTNAMIATMTSGIGGVSSMADGMGQLNAIVGNGNMRMEDLTGAISTGIMPAAASFGLSLKDVGAALDTATISGQHADEFATRLRMTFSQLAAPTKNTAKIFESLGLSSTELAEKMRSQGLLPALQDLKGHLDQTGAKLGLTGDALKNYEAAELSAAFGGGRQSSSILTLIQHLDTMKGAYDGITKGTNDFAADVQAASEDPANRMKMAVSKIDAVMIGLGEHSLPLVASGFTGLANVFGFLADHSDAVLPVLAAVGGGLIFLAISALPTLMGALYGVGAAMWAALGPWGVIAAVVIAVGVLIYEHWDWIKGKAGEIWDWIRDKVAGVWDWMKNAVADVVGFVRDHWLLLVTVITGPLGLIVGEIIKHWRQIKSAFSTAISFVINFVRGHWRQLIVLFTGPLGLIVDFVTAHWELVKQIFWGAMSFVENIVRTYFNLYKTIIMTALNVIASVFQWLWNSVLTPFGDFLANAFSAAWSAAQAAMQAVWDDVLVPIGNAFRGLWNDVLVPIGNFLTGVWDAAWSGAGAAMQAIKGIIDTISGALSDMLGPLGKVVDGLGKVKDASGWVGGKVGGGLSAAGGFLGITGGSAAGGWVGLNGPEARLVGEEGPEYVIPNHMLNSFFSGAGGAAQAVSPAISPQSSSGPHVGHASFQFNLYSAATDTKAAADDLYRQIMSKFANDIFLHGVPE